MCKLEGEGSIFELGLFVPFFLPLFFLPPVEISSFLSKLNFIPALCLLINL